jgi:hypothetical protein
VTEDVLSASIGFRPMGVLDDAIREHLDLKRQHGAEEEELRRQEEEALGPARREVGAADSEDGEVAASAEAEAAPEPEPSEAIPEEAPEPLHEQPAAPAAVEDVDGDEAGGDTPPQGFETIVDDEVHEDADLLEDEEPFEEDEEAAPSEAHADADDPDEADPDLLEDTPDFLQETPEHDRLWFEQKPPRDFDFD